MSELLQEVSHALDSANAAGFRKSSNLHERMMRRAKGEVVAEPVRPSNPTPPPPAGVYTPLVTITPVRTVQEENTVTIENKNIYFAISYPFDTKLMSIGINAMSIDISEDSVSILMQDTVKIKLPKLEPLHLEVEGRPYKVCWAGGMHNFGKFKHISFVVVE